MININIDILIFIINLKLPRTGMIINKSGSKSSFQIYLLIPYLNIAYFFVLIFVLIYLYLSNIE